MPQQEQNIALVKNGNEAFAAGDIDAAMNLFDDDVEWVQPGDSAVSGTYHGKAELGQLVSQLAEKSTAAAPQRCLADGDTVGMLGETTAGERNKRCRAGVYHP